ncbi:hypothetical protein [Psychroflexus maritimus]|uniref:Uncharacterized protein n=1 Tax=Psychroflexus maritimus TaxID=2714865 RepID=A0A967AD20_9FLAO|nr:hypothetical protein [Psychroflexus maritimus]NGZ89068.1 hypothetical protein [Psychroflexus maritimus]
MKKLILTLVMGVFAFGSSGFKANTPQPSSSSCLAEGVEIYNAALAYSGGNHEYAWMAFSSFYIRCTNVVQLELQP